MLKKNMYLIFWDRRINVIEFFVQFRAKEGRDLAPSSKKKFKKMFFCDRKKLTNLLFLQFFFDVGFNFCIIFRSIFRKFSTSAARLSVILTIREGRSQD